MEIADAQIQVARVGFVPFADTSVEVGNESLVLKISYWTLTITAIKKFGLIRWQHVLVQPEQVGWIVLCLDFPKPTVVFTIVAWGSVLIIGRHKVDISTFLGMGPESIIVIAHPCCVLFVVSRVFPAT